MNLMLPRNRFLSKFGSNELNPPHLSLERIVYQVGWYKMCIKTITLFSFSRKTQIWAIWLFFPLKLTLVEVLAHISNTYILDRAFSNDKSGRLKLQEHQAFDKLLKTYHIKNFPSDLKRVDTFGHILDPIHQGSPP